METRQQRMVFEVSYTARDLVLYALALGMGSRPEDASELRFLHEGENSFSGVPTFCFAFTFWAQREKIINEGAATTQGIPAFPPPLMSEEEVIPRRFLRNEADVTSKPVIHTWQSIVWHRPMEVPRGDPNRVITNHINLETIDIQPKSIGTFVTSQSKVVSKLDSKRKLLCTMQSTALVLGMDPNNVVPFNSGTPRQSFGPKFESRENEPPLFEWTYPTSRSQALLYRMASGDSNHIHVDTSAADMLGSEKKAPLLHGLFTLGLGFRGILKFFDSDEFGKTFHESITFRKLEGAFKAPGFVGDQLCVKIWKGNTKTDRTNVIETLLFVVTNKDTGAVLVDKGCAEVQIPSKLSSLISKL